MYNKKRAYPVPNYGANQDTTQQNYAIPPPPSLHSQVDSSQIPLTNQQQPNVVTGAPGGGVYGSAQVDHLSQSMAGMNVQDPYTQQQQVGGSYSPYGMYGQPQQSLQQPSLQQPLQQQQQQPLQQQQQQYSPALPMNQLYSTDLLKETPPPIADLQFPPPPIILAPGTTLTNNPESNSSPDYFRSTLNVVPTTSSLLKKSKLPLALIVRPYISLHDSTEPIPVVSDSIISRCRRCRSYINPFVQFTEQGKRWRCNFCALQNDVPGGFDIDKNTSQVRNRMDRIELNYGVVEFIAPPEYMVRPPQPLVYVFILDVSINSITNGLLATVTRTILDSLDRIPDSNQRARVAFLAVDSSLSFFTIPKDDEVDKEISMMIVSDLDNVLIPSPDSLLVNLKESRKNIEKLLNNFTNFFQDNKDTGSALGPALKSAHQLVQSIGGKIVCFSSSLPNLGIGKLALRDENAVSGKTKEASALLTPTNSFYKSFAVECNKSQITVDMFLTGSSYQDVATLSNLPRYTAGQTHFYPAWTANSVEDITKLTKEISNHLSMNIELEAVLRVRGSSGIRMSGFYGNFFNRSSDLCSFPTFPRDQSYVIEMSIDEYISKPYVYMQCAVLHTTSYGERRIRVMTLGLPTSKDLKDVYASADQLAITNYYTHKAIEKTLSSSLNDSREYLNKVLIDILSMYKKEIVPGNMGSSSPLQLCTNLRMLPLLLQSLIKHIGFRSGKVPSDHRSSALNKLSTLPLNKLINYIYPTIYSLHSMTDDCGLPFEGEDDPYDIPPKRHGEIVLPESINATINNFEKYGLYLINNTSELFLYIGGDAVPQLVNDVFGIENLNDVKIGKCELPILENEFNIRIRNIINKIREGEDCITFLNLYVVRGPSSNENAFTPSRDIIPLRMWSMSELVEDKVKKISN
ncbi:hypothetical protein CANARDRAFT_209447 [[Candida] arabinofermentans NRRL YB-2248]|uniref:Protein transport protein SEC24 n=1 Tax=[Candida] arabinofermentans NRRL YB-2248 TaxID=983967 RepID=A0A1E4SU72_9ASCO|nr:hypothetical protein CANARDRAFT_209447 [[Candida] arabinofermentans NRRL YB-2248]